MKQKIKQILYDLRHQPIIAWVTLLATAMSIFLIMMVVMIQRVQVIPYPPESCRDRLMTGKYIDLKQGHNNMSSAFSYLAGKELYDGLDGVERISFTAGGQYPADVRGTTNDTFSAIPICVDSEFFNIFDHTLVAGRYFTPEETEADLPLTILTESTARKAFGTIDCIGEKLLYRYSNQYTVVGVVKDHSRLAKTASADMFINCGPTNSQMSSWNQGQPGYELLGSTEVVLLLKDGVDPQYIRDQVKGNYAKLNTKLADQGFEVIYHGAPFDQEQIAAGVLWSNADNDATQGRRMRYLLYAILLIVPAINLSGMLHSRMSRRVSEIGVRRAFGCTRRRIITDIITENFIFTLIGGLVGLSLGMLFASTYSGLYTTSENFGSELTPSLAAIFNWGTILIALGVCFLLNIISASLPAWQASRLSVVNAINAK